MAMLASQLTVQPTAECAVLCCQANNCLTLGPVSLAGAVVMPAMYSIFKQVISPAATSMWFFWYVPEQGTVCRKQVISSSDTAELVCF